MDDRRDAGTVPPPVLPQSASATGKPKTSAGVMGGTAAVAATVVSPTKAAQPQFGAVFDPWNSSSSGHQHAENRLGASTGWRDSVNAKLHSQFRGDARRMSDAVSAGARDWDPKLQAVVPPELRARARCSVADMLAKPGTMQRSLSSLSSSSTSTTSPSTSSPGIGVATTGTANRGGQDWTSTAMKGEGGRSAESAWRTDDGDKGVSPVQEQGPGRLFDGVVVYVNGCTHPQISDHKLKHVLAEHGGRLSSHLGRKQVTHVILGRPAGGGGGGAGGGLAGSKLQKEIQKTGGAAVKFVGVEWCVSNLSIPLQFDFLFSSPYPLCKRLITSRILESIRAGKRLPEARFSNLKVASKGQQSVFGLFSKPTPLPPVHTAESCMDSSGVGSYPTSLAPLGDEPPPSAQRN
ncbi:hypothetical protein PG994_010511 [Apiospora phragmitis]|uniref:BRCT domain-containing protein n=1 Tax=Apiospora phragmitis TaxID=2905665 RepID=A0ABR1TQ63_9PEZI